MTVKPADNYVSFLEAKLATEIGPHESRELVESNQAVYLDVRSTPSYNEGHVPGCMHVPRRELEGRLKDVPKNKIVITYCSDVGCQASLKAAIILRKHGFDARHMIGGFRLWQDKAYPVETTPTPLIAPRPKE